jgi:DNA-binding response OmpR family regulator
MDAAGGQITGLDLGLYLSNPFCYTGGMMLNPVLSGRRLKIVWVEDSLDLIELLGPDIQEAFPDADFRYFLNGDEAWKWLDRESPDLLISDLGHPGMHGLEMLARLCLKDVAYPIVIVSGIVNERKHLARRLAGPRLKVHYRAKPFEIDPLISLLEQCLNRSISPARLMRWSASLPRPLRIVQLDDEPAILQIAAKLLRGCLQNALLCQFQNSPSAWRILTEDRPDLLITDDIMHSAPEWNGEGIVRRLVAKPVEYPILVLSARAPTQAWVHRLQANGSRVSFLGEPFAPAHFYRELGKCLGPLKF